MNKRQATEDAADQPSEKKGGAEGKEASTVQNVIPRLFSQNSITIHISQRTFEEISPKELKWCPSSQFFAAMFDKFHFNQFDSYYRKCDTFTVNSPKVRISNILMLQDDQTTITGTPKDNSVFTQACYILKYSPKGMKNWFKLGITNDCMKTQKLLKYKPFQYTNCTNHSQLVNVGEGVYEDFEKLIINPAKTNQEGGWVQGVTLNVSRSENLEELDLPSGYQGETEIDKIDLERYYITNTYICPTDRYLHPFSSSFKGTDPFLSMGKHTTYCRNLDSISLHKYGDVIEWGVNTNVEGMALMKHSHNNPWWGTTDVKINEQDYVVEWAFSYPSNNRNFNCRSDNLTSIDSLTRAKNFKPLSHTFLTMPPIKKADGTLIKQRCSFIMEQSLTVTFNFPETIYEDEFHEQTHQRDGIILRPSIIALHKKKPEEKTPTPPPPPPPPDKDKIANRRSIPIDNIRWHLRSRIIYANSLPTSGSLSGGSQRSMLETLMLPYSQYAQEQIKRLYDNLLQITTIAALIQSNVKGYNIQTKSNWEQILGNAPAAPVTDIDKLIEVHPKVGNQIDNQTRFDITELKYILNNPAMIADGLTTMTALWGYCFKRFLQWQYENQLQGVIEADKPIWHDNLKPLEKTTAYQKSTIIGHDLHGKASDALIDIWEGRTNVHGYSFKISEFNNIYVLKDIARVKNPKEWNQESLHEVLDFNTMPEFKNIDVITVSYFHYWKFMHMMGLPLYPFKKQSVLGTFNVMWNKKLKEAVNKAYPILVITNQLILEKFPEDTGHENSFLRWVSKDEYISENGSDKITDEQIVEAPPTLYKQNLENIDDTGGQQVVTSLFFV